MRSTCLSSNLLNEVSSLLGYFEVRVRYRRKKFTFAISSPDEFLYFMWPNRVTLNR